MGKFEKGILGSFSGKVGPVVGGSWKGIDYMRSKSRRRRKGSFTEAQLEQQAKFGLVVKLTGPLKDLLAVTFKEYAVNKTGANSATAYILKNAITGTYPAYTLAYPLVLVSRGDLPNADAPAAALGTAGAVNFSWTSNAGIGKAKGTDKSILVAYCPALSMAVYTIEGPDRSTGAGSLNLSVFKGNTVHTWLAFTSTDRQPDVSNSVYTGSVLIP